MLSFQSLIIFLTPRPTWLTSVPVSGGCCESSHCILQEKGRKSHAGCFGKGPPSPKMRLLLVFWLSCPLAWRSAAVWDVRQSCEWRYIFPGPHLAVLGFSLFFTDLHRQNIEITIPEIRTFPFFHHRFAWTMCNMHTKIEAFHAKLATSVTHSLLSVWFTFLLSSKERCRSCSLTTGRGCVVGEYAYICMQLSYWDGTWLCVPRFGCKWTCISFLFCQHPYIYRVTFATANESSALLIRMFNEKGTLKDLIYKVLLVQVNGHKEIHKSL